MARSKKKVPQYAIAEQLGISRSTVSKVFSNREDVSEEMRLKVMNAAYEMGYDYAPHADVKLEQDCPRVGVLVRLGAEAPTGYRADYLESLSAFSFEAGVALTAHLIPSKVSEEELFGDGGKFWSLHGSQLDALLLTGPWSECGLVLASQLMPSVAIAYGALYSAIDTVEPDTFGAMRKVVKHFHSLGHQRVAFVGHCPEVYWATERYASFMASCPAVGIEVPPECIVRVNCPLLWQKDADDAWAPIISQVVTLIRKRGVTALACSSDWTAYHVYSGLRQLGISIPGDVSLTGFDDHEIINWGCPKVSTIQIPRERLACHAVARLLRRVTDHTLPIRRGLYECSFMDHGTIAPVRRT